MGNAANVKMGVCNVSFGGSDLGYTKGYVKLNYTIETTEKTVDQEDAPIDEILTSQKFEVKVPLAEQDLARLKDLLPGSTLVTDGTKKKLTLSGAAGTSLIALAKELVVAPVGGDANDAVTLHHAVPVPSIDFAYEKDNVRVFEVTFKAMKGANGFVTFGDKTATGV